MLMAKKEPKQEKCETCEINLDDIPETPKKKK